MASHNFTLYLNSSFPRSLWANDLRDLTRLCQQFVRGDYSIDILQRAEVPQRAFRDGVVNTPTILLQAGEGRKQTLGNLAETEKFLRLLQASDAAAAK
jgi:circadian clock protein KaiB